MSLTLSPPPSSETMVMITVSDINDNSPQFSGEPYVTQISEVSYSIYTGIGVGTRGHWGHVPPNHPTATPPQ